MKDEHWKNARAIVSPTFSTAKLKTVYHPFCFYLTTLPICSIQMFNLMNEVSDNYNKRLLEYADKQEIFDIKMCVSVVFFNNDNLICSILFYIDRLDSEFTLDNIATCLFGIQTNSLQKQNLVLIKYLKKIFEVSARLILLLIFCKYK